MLSDQKQNSYDKIKASADILLQSLKGIKYGKIEITLPFLTKTFNFQGELSGPEVSMVIHDPQVFDEILKKSDIGLGESYINNQWSTNSITNLIEFAIRNKEFLKKAMIGQWQKLLIYKFKHFLNYNSKNGSKKNISFHYDLGNDFYKLWLDSSMTYSSAFWGDNLKLSLNEAQINKYSLILEQLQAEPGSHILEIGCGWGGFAEFAGKKGYKVTAITISQQQYEYAQNRIQAEGLDSKVTISLTDFRDLKGQFNHIVSIEMIEAVGERYWSHYFEQIKKLLTPGGSASIQSIIIKDEDFQRYRKETDFIQQYIFPGGMLPSKNELQKLIKNIDGKQINMINFGLDYARTLLTWQKAFLEKLDLIKNMGFKDDFCRMWNFYLEYCAGSFQAGQINVVLISFKLT